MRTPHLAAADQYRDKVLSATFSRRGSRRPPPKPPPSLRGHCPRTKQLGTPRVARSRNPGGDRERRRDGDSGARFGVVAHGAGVASEEAPAAEGPRGFVWGC